ncbi:MAG: hypothetical protein Ct9H300mP1_24980 [Planctomycetaceae bacterium]|nr:MAG: hypothetical protein Ct9H300mP1_24980 [Planctomycetaceae bacterium]
MVTLFSREFGKIAALAKGGGRLKGPFEAALDLLATCQIVFPPQISATLDFPPRSQADFPIPAPRPQSPQPLFRLLRRRIAVRIDRRLRPLTRCCMTRPPSHCSGSPRTVTSARCCSGSRWCCCVRSGRCPSSIAVCRAMFPGEFRFPNRSPITASVRLFWGSSGGLICSHFPETGVRFPHDHC